MFTLKSLGLHYNNTKTIKMFYSSMHHFSKEFLKKEFNTANERKYLIALGTISSGIHGNEPSMSLKILKRDLIIAKQAGIKEIIIFRLGGLNKSYKKVLTKNS